MSSTRTLLLGVLHDGPMHGYEVRRRLELWGADQWATIAYGSIYHGLSQMAKEGLLEVVEGGTGARTIYAITDEGRQTFGRLLAEFWWTVKPLIDPFMVALTFMDKLPRDQLLGALAAREAQLRGQLVMLETAGPGKVHHGAPRHIASALELSASRVRAELDWVVDAAEKVKGEELP